MRFPIDVLFLDRDQQVVKSISDLIPNRLTPVCLCAASVLELPGGTLAGIRIAIGERVLFL
jgi:uncharacterized membrane protein (UPF0127 family)